MYRGAHVHLSSSYSSTNSNAVANSAWYPYSDIVFEHPFPISSSFIYSSSLSLPDKWCWLVELTFVSDEPKRLYSTKARSTSGILPFTLPIGISLSISGNSDLQPVPWPKSSTTFLSFFFDSFYLSLLLVSIIACASAALPPRLDRDLWFLPREFSQSLLHPCPS